MRRTRVRPCTLALLLVLAGCSSDGTDQPSGTPLPDELVGQWQTVLTYVPAYWEGVIPTADFNGSLGIFFYFWPDGRYQLDLNSALTYFGGNCFRTTRRIELGSVSMAGSVLTFHAARATSSILDSCGETKLEEVDPGDPGTISVTHEQDPAGWPLLRLSLPSGEDLLLEKCRDCG